MMSVFLPIGAYWIYTLLDWAPTQEPSSSDRMAFMVFHLGYYSERIITWSFINFDKHCVGPTATPFLKQRDLSFASLLPQVFQHYIWHYLLRISNHTWNLQQTSSFLAVEVEGMTIRKATSVSFLYYFGWRLRLRLWRQTTKLPLVVSHFIFSYHISSHIKTLFGSIHRKSFMTIHSKLICMRLRFWFLPTSTYQSTYEHFNSFLHNIAILQRRGGDVV